MDEKIKRLRKWKNGKTAPPYSLEFNITNKCNLRCRYCWLRSTNPDVSKELTDEKLLKTVKEAADLGIRQIRIPGSGEPTIRDNVLTKMITKIKENNIHGLLITNGTLFDEEIIDKMIKLEWDNITISVDAPTADKHDHLSFKEGTFQKVTNLLEIINHKKKKFNTQKPKIRFNTVLTNKNYSELPELIEFANKVNCKDIQVQPMTPFSDLGEKYVFDKKQKILDNYLKKALKLTKKYDIYTNIDSFISNDVVKRTDEMDEVAKEDSASLKKGNEFVSAPCFQPWYNMVILPNGKTAQCSIFGGKGGVQLKDKSLKEVWHSNYFENVRKRILNKDLFSYCENCCVPLNQENKEIRKALV